MAREHNGESVSGLDELAAGRCAAASQRSHQIQQIGQALQAGGLVQRILEPQLGLHAHQLHHCMRDLSITCITCMTF